MSKPYEKRLAEARQQMASQITLHAGHVSAHTGIEAISDRVMTVMGTVPRHEFVPEQLRPYAYLDQPLPIGHDKTISQPFIVALMTELLDIGPQDRVLEIGTGLGYQAAVLASLAQQIYTIEIIEELAREAHHRLAKLGYSNVSVTVGDGARGWFVHAPLDRVIVTAAPELIPTPLLNQLKAGGRMVVPAGIEGAQQLILVEKGLSGSTQTREVLPVAFSPMVVSH